MKTVFLFLFLVPLFLLSCEKGAHLQEAPAGVPADTQADKPAPSSCPYPEYDPPDIVPGTNCHDPCQFVYEGWVDFEEGLLDINCQRLPLSSPSLSFSIDSTLIRQVGVGYLKILRIQAPGIGAWCADKAFFLAEGCPAPERTFLYVGHDGVSEFQVVWPKGFWDCAAGKRINFRLIARNPLGLRGEGEP